MQLVMAQQCVPARNANEYTGRKYYRVCQGLTSIPLNLPYDLVEMTITYNQIPSLQANAFGTLAACDKAWLHDNGINSIATNAFVGLSRVTYLYLQRNNLVSLQQGIFNGLDSISLISLSNNKISQVSPGFLGPSSTGLGFLYLSHNRISYMEPEIFNHYGFNKLQQLWLDNNALTTLKWTMWRPEMRSIHNNGLSLRLEENRIFCNASLCWLKNTRGVRWMYGPINAPSCTNMQVVWPDVEIGCGDLGMFFYSEKPFC